LKKALEYLGPTLEENFNKQAVEIEKAIVAGRELNSAAKAENEKKKEKKSDIEGLEEFKKYIDELEKEDE
jgi:hypothetical protein